MQRRHRVRPVGHRSCGGHRCGRHRRDRHRRAAQKTKELAAATINGSGATFPQGYYDECREAFNELQPNITVNYPNPGGGSGKGRQEFADQVTQWGASDAPYPSADLAKIKGGSFLYVPTVTAPITVSYNLSGVTKPLKFTAATMAKIFQGDITTWNDAAIAADNPGVKLPSTKITIARRSDSSGTTQNFTGYLTKAAGSVWKLGHGLDGDVARRQPGWQRQPRCVADREGDRRRDRLRRLLRRQGHRPDVRLGAERAGQVHRPDA